MPRLLPTKEEVGIVNAFILLIQFLGEEVAKTHPNTPGHFLRVTWPNGQQNPSPTLHAYCDQLKNGFGVANPIWKIQTK